MKLFLIYGGLGNQLFQYSYSLQISDNADRIMYLDATHCFDSRFKFELNFLNVKPILRIPKVILFFIRVLSRYTILQYISGVRVINDSGKCTHIKNSWLTIYDGYWQKLDTAKVILKKLKQYAISFQSNNDLREHLFINEKKVCNMPLLAIHVRRGDFFKANSIHAVCDAYWYKTAIKHIESKVGPTLKIFSNDNQWVETNFASSDSIIFKKLFSTRYSFIYESGQPFSGFQ